MASIYTFEATLDASQVVDGGGSTSTATGTAIVTLDDTLFTVTTNLTWSGLTGPADRAHLHWAPLGLSRHVVDPNEFFFHEVLDTPFLTVNCTYGISGACVPASGSSTDVLQLAANDGYGAGSVVLNDPVNFTDGTFADLITALTSGVIYIDMHTEAFPSGEIRGQLAAVQLAAVPEPWTVSLLGMSLFGLAIARGGRWSGAPTGK
jgi:hypothetical protein